MSVFLTSLLFGAICRLIATLTRIDSIAFSPFSYVSDCEKFCPFCPFQSPNPFSKCHQRQIEAISTESFQLRGISATETFTLTL